ncbi:MAG: hypothetical protein IJU40_07675, partial [Desulfovibrionaceae bacterium]|nr:hypothetical protein [Desulfovibrionaceae bacterium]
NGGKDVVVYDKTKGGKDIIKSTNGSCTLLFKDLSSSDIKQELNGTTKIITKKSDTSQKITISGWSNNTHNIKFGSNMSNFAKYIKASNPTNEVCTKAYNEAFNKAGLANCTVKLS